MVFTIAKDIIKKAFAEAGKERGGPSYSTREGWYKDGKLDRAHGPALIERDVATGVVTREEWYKDGKLHRADGPALIERDAATGLVTRNQWWKNGREISPGRASSPGRFQAR